MQRRIINKFQHRLLIKKNVANFDFGAAQFRELHNISQLGCKQGGLRVEMKIDRERECKDR